MNYRRENEKKDEPEKKRELAFESPEDEWVDPNDRQTCSILSHAYCTYGKRSEVLKD